MSTYPISKTIDGLLPGATYMIQVRAKNGENRYSDWSHALIWEAPPTGRQFNIYQSTRPTAAMTPPAVAWSLGQPGYIVGFLPYSEQILASQPIEITFQCYSSVQNYYSGTSVNNDMTPSWRLNIFKTVYNVNNYAISNTSGSLYVDNSYGYGAYFVTPSSAAFGSHLITGGGGVVGQISAGGLPGIISSNISPSVAYVASAVASGGTNVYFICASAIATGSMTAQTFSYGTPISSTLLGYQEFKSASSSNAPGVQFTAVDFSPAVGYITSYYASIISSTSNGSAPGSPNGLGTSLQLIGNSNSPITMWAKPIFGNSYGIPTVAQF